jgi:DNA-binding CsgD family transcriptional regulator/tetratricopeptide (TPR) repeat protein
VLFGQPPGRNIGLVPRRVSSPVFVGRRAEQAALSEALDRAAAGDPGIVLISGEAGVGKSRLLAEITTLAATKGVASVRGICVDVAAGSLAYAPFVDIVRELHQTGFTGSLPAATLAEIGRLVPEAMKGAKGFEAAGGGQGRIFAAVRDLLTIASVSRPILIAIEDLHWADTSTLDLVTYLARSMQSERCLIVATARIDALPRRHPLLATVAALSRLPAFERIELPRFDESELDELLTGILGAAPDPGMTQVVFERSDGNAFFAEELVAAGAGLSGSMPESLRDVLAARLATLDDAAERVVRVAAVAGREVSHELLEQVAEISSSELIAALREAVDLGILLRVDEPSPGYAFRHALAREAAADELLAPERIAIHRAIADALERDHTLAPGGDLARTGEIAFHAMAARDLPRALTASLEAVAVAEAASAFAEAEAHLQRILEVWPRIPDAAGRVDMDKPGLLARTARAAAAAGHQTHAVKLAVEALAEFPPSDAERRITTLLELFDYAWEAADIETAEEAVAEALPLVRDERSARGARAFAEGALLEWHHGRYSAARERALEAIAMARGCAARQELALALTVVGQIYTHLGATNQAREAFTEAAGILEVHGDPDVKARSVWWRSWALYMHGHFADSLAMIRLGLETARREGADGRYGVHLSEIVLDTLVALGRWAEARAVGEQILSRLTMSFEMVYTHGTLARMETLLGRPAQAAQDIAQGAKIQAFGQHRVWQLEDGIFLAYTAGRYADGRRDMERAIAALPEPEHDATLWWSLLKSIAGEADRADAARRRRRTAEAEEAVAAGRRFAELLGRSANAAVEADGGSPMTEATLRTGEAEAARLEGRPDPAAWAVAVQARSALEQPWEIAYARYRHAEAILASGRPAADAAPPLRAAHAAARDLGAAPLRVAIEALASRGRIRLDRTPEDEAPAATRAATELTARELEVLALVAAGHTNREIGERLFISEKTASVHVTHAMNKLGALSRYEAAAAATRQGLLEAT